MASTWTMDDYAALKSAIAKGVRLVQYEGQRVEYQSTADMLRVLAMMEAELGLKSRSQRRFAYVNRGV